MRKPKPLNLLLTFLSCAGLVFLPCRGGAEDSPGEPPSVYYGGPFTQKQAETLVLAMGWLRGLELAAEELGGLNAVRLADLNFLQRQGLAALLGMPHVIPRYQNPDPGRDGDAEAKISADVSLGEADRSDLPRYLARTEQRQRHVEVIVALRRLVSEARDLAGSRAARSSSGIPGTPGSMVSLRLISLVRQIEAYELYRATLKKHGDAWENPAQILPELGKALVLAPQALPMLISQGEMLLHLDRPAAALRGLEGLPYPAGTSASTASTPGETEERIFRQADMALYVRGLRLRALAHLSLEHMALAENDLSMALEIAPEQGDLWLARGAVRQIGQRYAAMCGDYRQACALGLCDGLAAARKQGYCPAEKTP